MTIMSMYRSDYVMMTKRMMMNYKVIMNKELMNLISEEQNRSKPVMIPWLKIHTKCVKREIIVRMAAMQ